MKNYDILKTTCRKIFIVGSGNFWYEEDGIGNDENIYYHMFTAFLYSIYLIMTILEIMAALFGDYPDHEKREAITFSVTHTIVMIKIIIVLFNKKIIKSLNRNMVRICEEHEEPTLMMEKYKIIKINFILYLLSVFSAVWCYIFEGFRRYFEGSHFVTVVTYYPKFEDESILANSFRVFCTLVLNALMINMILSVDGFTVIHLVMFKYKFITLRHYFEDLREDFLKMNVTDARSATERLSNGLVKGIIMHKELLSVAEEIDNAFGDVIALQLFLSSGSAVSLLLQVALSDKLTFVSALKIVFFVVAVFMLLGLFLCNAGEITYQASLINESIFYCGWHECVKLTSPHRDPSKLVLLACVQAQRPLVMKAFKMVELSYSTFLQVVRVTYSVFTLFYTRNE